MNDMNDMNDDMNNEWDSQCKRFPFLANITQDLEIFQFQILRQSLIYYPWKIEYYKLKFRFIFHFVNEIFHCQIELVLFN